MNKMKRRSFLGVLVAAGAAPALPALTGTSPALPKATFWARYLSALHGPASAAHIATFSGASLATAAEAQVAVQGTKQIRHMARWIVYDDLDADEATS